MCDECQMVARARTPQARASASGLRPQGPPTAGMSVERCSPSQLADLHKLWVERQGQGSVAEAWRVDNPLRTWHFHQRRTELVEALGREPDELHGFHGTHPDNVLSICENGFDSGRRAGQVFGSGEYFAKCPNVSVGYCRGGEYMIVCRLCLGFESSTPENRDGDHIWVPSQSYYVIASPPQVLPLFIVRFTGSFCRAGVQSPELSRVLSAGTYTTKRAEAIVPVPRNRACLMSRASATVLWIGFLHAHLSDEELRRDVEAFLTKHAPELSLIHI